MILLYFPSGVLTIYIPVVGSFTLVPFKLKYTASPFPVTSGFFPLIPVIGPVCLNIGRIY